MMSKDKHDLKEHLIESVVDTQEQAGVDRSADRADKWLTPILEENERKGEDKKQKHTFDSTDKDREGVTKESLDIAEVDFANNKAYDSEGKEVFFHRRASDKIRDRISWLMSNHPLYAEQLDVIFRGGPWTPQQKNAMVRRLIAKTIAEHGPLQ